MRVLMVFPKRRSLYGVRNADADILEDETESCLWCWKFICEDVEDCKAKTWSWRISCSDFRAILVEDTAACSIRVEMLFICYQRDFRTILAEDTAACSICVEMLFICYQRVSSFNLNLNSAKFQSSIFGTVVPGKPSSLQLSNPLFSLCAVE
ncbi:hypothetical protein ACSBR1_008683 [Camellia fascicularis]